MRADVVFRVILNVRLLPEMPFQLRNEKYLETVACEKPDQVTKFLFRFKNAQEAEECLKQIEANK